MTLDVLSFSRLRNMTTNWQMLSIKSHTLEMSLYRFHMAVQYRLLFIFKLFWMEILSKFHSNIIIYLIGVLQKISWYVKLICHSYQHHVLYKNADCFIQNISINTCFTDNLCCYLLTLTYVTYTMLLLQFLMNHFPSNLIVR